ncbi:MAG TPA: two-component regulator propeller domain-containing protein, partial [Flavisolibacter sp.]
MVFKNSLLLLLFVLFFSTGSQAQQESINFTAITTREGLASNTVNAILKDRFGFIWFGTEDGLDRFDGTGFTVYRNIPNDTTSLQANEILALHEDAAGNLWIGTSGGSLSLYNRKKDAFTNFPANGGPGGLANNVIRDICHDEKGNIWIVHYTGVNILDPKTGKVSSLNLTKGQTGQAAEITGTAIFRDSRNTIWIGTTQGLWQYHPGTRQTRHFTHDPANPLSLSGRQVNAITEDKEGTLWIGTNNGLSMMKAGNLSFVNYRESGGGDRTMKSDDFINDIKVEGNQLWIGTGTGLKVFNKRIGQQTEYTQDPRNHFSLSGQSVQCVYIDQQGIYWLGTFRGGVNKYDKNLNLFNHIRSNVFDNRGLNVPTVTSFAEGEQGKLFVGTDGGLSVFDRQTNYFEQVPLSSRRSGAPSHPAILA